MLFIFKGIAGAWEALFVYDSILFGFTLYKTLKERHDHRITGINVTLISLILRDGETSSTSYRCPSLTTPTIGCLYFA